MPVYWFQGENPLEKELRLVARQEKKLEQTALAKKDARWREELEKKIPESVNTGLESAFCKGFALVFDQGRAIIEKSFRKETILDRFAAQADRVRRQGSRKEYRKMHTTAAQSDFVNLAVTTVEGIALGALGVGMPDIILFLTTLLRGVYETALNYGFPYDTIQEQMLILHMLEASLSTGEDWKRKNREVDEMLELESYGIRREDLDSQIQKTASAFAVDMLILKFIQGMPVVGILGGAANPVYYLKVMKYVQLKYRKRYLNRRKDGLDETADQVH